MRVSTNEESMDLTLFCKSLIGGIYPGDEVGLPCRTVYKGEQNRVSVNVRKQNTVLTVDQIIVICTCANRNGVEYQVSLIPGYLNHHVSPVRGFKRFTKNNISRVFMCRYDKPHHKTNTLDRILKSKTLSEIVFRTSGYHVVAKISQVRTGG